MNYYAVLCLAIASVALAAPAPQHPEDQPVQILKQDSTMGIDGYQFDFETSDGTSRQEQGTLKQLSDEVKALEVKGSYRYRAPDGLFYAVTFVADEHGFQPSEHVEHPDQGQQPQYQQQ